MDQISLNQNKEIETWTKKRDDLLGEISILTTEKEQLKKGNISLGASSTDLQSQIDKAKGRLIELDKNEHEYKNKISKEVSDLKVEKAKLDFEVPILRKEIVELRVEEKSTLENLTALALVQERVFNRTDLLNEIIEKVTQVSKKNISDIDTFIENLKISITKLIKTNENNIEKTNIVIERLPKVLFELRRPQVIRKSFLDQK